MYIILHYNVRILRILKLLSDNYHLNAKCIFYLYQLMKY